MPAPARTFVLAALGLLAVSGSADAAPRGPVGGEDLSINALFLTTFAPVAVPNGVKYGARLTCGPLEGACIASATMSLTLTDGSGNVVHTYDTEFTGEEAGTSWRVVTKAAGVGTGTFCGFASVNFTLPDGSTGSVESAEAVCAEVTE